MPTININDIPVEFPHQPYPCQLNFLSSLLGALRDGQHALLESPTGTGKTLGLLCGSLAWRVAEMAGKQREICVNPSSTDNSDKPPVIIYASRTHSQLTQVIGELRRTTYRPRIAIIGSREQMCLKEGVRDLKTGSGAQAAVCQRLVKKKSCEFNQRVGEALQAREVEVKGGQKRKDEIWDIENLVEFASQHRACPYYMSREMVREADLIFMPYNYLLDARTRAALTAEVDLKGAVIIFDEAHNVEGSCYDAVSCEIDSDDLVLAGKELEGCKELMEITATVNESTIKNARLFLASLHAKMTDPAAAISPETGFLSQPGDAIFGLLEGAGLFGGIEVHGGDVEAQLAEFENLAKALVEDQFTRRSSKRIAWQSIVTALKSIYDCGSGKMTEAELDATNEEMTQKRGEKRMQVLKRARIHYRMVLSNQMQMGPMKGNNAIKRTLAFWCFNPGVVMNDLLSKGVRSIVLTSGTLSPMRSFIQEMQIDFKYILENEHVIDDDQVYATVVGTGPSGIPLNSSFNQRDSVSYQRELGLTVLKAAQRIPQGLLVFFPSYQVMDTCLKVWQNEREGPETIFNQIRKLKFPILEPKLKHDLPSAMDQYTRHIVEGKGSIFFAVCRGKVSEGLDFADGLARGVIVTGIPYPPFKDPKIILKKQYLQGIPGSSLSGQEWYNQQASRAVNQALGRVIRHRRDFGCILLCDERFAKEGTLTQLSKWLRGRVKTGRRAFEGVEGDLDEFFYGRNLGGIAFASEVKESSTHPYALKSNASIAVPVKLDLEISSSQNVPKQPALPSAQGTVKKFNWFNESLIGNSNVNSNPSSNSNSNSQAPIPTPTTSSNSASITPAQKQQLAQDYLKRVQKALPATSYTSFLNTLREFKAGKMVIAQVLSGLAIIFKEAEDARSLYSDFRAFVPAKHLQLFESSIETNFALTETEANFKRKLHPELIGKRRLSLEPLYPQAGVLEVVGKEVVEVENILSNPTVPSNLINPTQINSTANQSDSIPDNCPICRDQMSEAHRAKCGHCACLTCWHEWLNRTLECPLCRQRTRIPQLRRI